MRESEFQANVIELARTLGWRVHHDRPAMNRRGEWATPIQGDPGYPDLTLVRKGRVVFAELKAEKGLVSVAQHAWLSELDGLEVFVWRPSDIQTIAKVLGPQVVPATVAHTPVPRRVRS